jgi:Ni,Fe-hydrogenase III large subunit/Ni,Fe-hydrogenase III component G
MLTENIKKYVPEKAKIEIKNNVVAFEVPADEIKNVIGVLHNDLALKIITATDERDEDGCFKIWYVFGVPQDNAFVAPFIRLKSAEEFPSVVSVMHEALNYERKIKTFFGLSPVGNPDMRPIILQDNWPAEKYPLRKNFAWNERPAKASNSYPFQKVDGEGIYEIPVGPIHAGIIEPGHFRFSVAGEEIMLLEPRLGYTHKGSEKLFETLPLDGKVRLSEKISGDSSFAHSLAFCQALERLSGLEAPKRALYLRVIFAELERLANHFGDIGAIMIDTGFNFGGSQGARLREMIMQINERLTGSRFLRNVNIIGGAAKDISDSEKNKLSAELKKIAKDFSEVIAVAESSATLANRLIGTGTVSPEVAKDFGVLGLAAKAVGIARDTRADYPYAAYGELHFDEIATEQDGDVRARFRVRIKEAYASMDLIQRALRELPSGPLSAPADKIKPEKDSVAISVVEGWRGEIVYFITTDKHGDISRVAPRDPSFINWAAAGEAGPGNVVPDFPLINKSFNLSYSGNDL